MDERVARLKTPEECEQFALNVQARLPDLARALLAFSRRLAIVHAPPGVRKFRTMEEANTERNAWVVETLMKPPTGEAGAGG